MSNADNQADQGRSAFVPGLLGTLRSELDEGSELDWAFGSLESSVSAVRSAFLSHRLTPHAAGVLLGGLRLNGSDGSEWTVGATSGSWYRKIEGSWERSGAPEGIRVVGETPSWVANGIGKEIAAAESAARAAFGSDEPVVVAAAPVVVTPLLRQERTAVEDEISWLLDEWKASPAALPQAPAVPKVGGTAMPGFIPTVFQPAAGLDNAVDALTGSTPAPAPRAKSEAERVIDDVEDNATYRQTSRDGFVLPQEFFLAPEPQDKRRDALDDEIALSTSAWSDLRTGDDTNSDATAPTEESVSDGPAPITLDDVLAVGRAAHAARAKEAEEREAEDAARTLADATPASTSEDGRETPDNLYDPTREDDAGRENGYL